MVGWSSGWGVHEAAAFLEKKIDASPAVIFVRADSGNPEDAMYLYVQKNKNVRVFPLTYLEQVTTGTKNIPGISYYFISRGTQMGGLERQTTQLARFHKPLDEEFVGVYRYWPND
mgnify:FL=1